MLTSKIHRATVTPADLQHVGSVTVDENPMDTADLVILIAYGQMEDAEARRHVPRVVFVDDGNRITGTGGEPPQALPALLRGDQVHAGSDVRTPAR